MTPTDKVGFPPTIIIRHKKERPRKCTIIPLKGRPDIRVFLHPVRNLPPLEGYVRLAADGPPLTENDSRCGLLLLDSSWRRVRGMLSGVEHLPKRSLHGYKTAFPRSSKLGTDPENSLASVEAIYLAYHLLGRPTAGLLDHYQWAGEFIRLNNFSETLSKESL